METQELDPQREYFPFLLSFKEAIDELPQKYRLEIYEAITDYAFFKIEPELKSIYAKLVWKIISPILQKSWKKVESGRTGGGQIGNQNAVKNLNDQCLNFERAKNEQKTSKRRSNIEQLNSIGQANGNIEIDNEKEIKNNDNNNEDEINNMMPGGVKPSRKRETKSFTKPSLQEVINFISENSFSVDPEAFYDYYESNGWMVGRNRMKDWKSTIRRWNRTEFQQKRVTVTSTPELAGSGVEVTPKENEPKEFSERF